MTLEQLGKGFSLDTDNPAVRGDGLYLNLNYENEHICILIYSEDLSVEDIKEDTPIKGIGADSSEKFGNYLQINSVTFGTEWSEITSSLGTPTRKSGQDGGPRSLWMYPLDDEDKIHLLVGVTNGKVEDLIFGAF